MAFGFAEGRAADRASVAGYSGDKPSGQSAPGNRIPVKRPTPAEKWELDRGSYGMQEYT